VYLLDTDVLIDIQRGFQPAVDWFAGLDETPAVPGLTAMELIQDARNAQEVRNAQELVAAMPILWPRPAACAEALAEYARLHLSHNLGLIDALIAACAMDYSAELVTFNVRHYRAFRGLHTIQPYDKS